MNRPRLKTILWVFTTFLTLIIISSAAAFFNFDSDLTQKMEAKKFIQPTEFYSAPLTFKAKMLLSMAQVEELLQKNHFRQRSLQQRLLPGDYFAHSSLPDCATRMQAEIPETASGCIAFSNPSSKAEKMISPAPEGAGEAAKSDETPEVQLQWILFDQNQSLLAVFEGFPARPTSSVSLQPSLFAQYIGTSPIMQEPVMLGEIPPNCLNAVMAIEDAAFLEHKGFSFTGLIRAFVKNLKGDHIQGGSTITQQLVKNYFLTSEKTYRRKISELFMSILVEAKFSKDQILEMYLNIIYMGQNGPFQIVGFPAASRYYFQKSISELNLSECALLAAVLNGPGVYDPFNKVEKTTARRNRVLDKMKDLSLISEGEWTSAQQLPLPQKRPSLASETAPYFIDAVRKQMKELGLPLEGVKIYTSLNLEAQQAAQLALQSHLGQLEKNQKNIKTLREKGFSLEGVVLSGEPDTGLINVAVGGRSFRMTQFNRAVDGHRQVGSIMKPVVYLTALSKTDSEGKAYTPISLVADEKMEIKYEGQKWSPVNYTKEFYGSVPLFYALKNSLNAATAKLGMEVGLKEIIATARALGVKSEMKTVPALTLGAFEMYPKEVLQAYMTLTNLGMKPQLSFMTRVVDSEGKVLFEHKPELVSSFDPIAVSSLVSMMKQTVLSGSARSVTLSGFTHPSAGKTGTTSDEKDAWFAGFTPYRTTVVWVGYDNNLTSKLTGSSGAVPVWTEFMKKTATQYPPDDFDWPEETVKVSLDPEALKKLNAVKEGEEAPASVELIFKKGTEP